MEFAKVRPKQTVLSPRQNLVAEELVNRHAAAQSTGRSQHARAENCRSLTTFQRFQKIRQTLRRILPVSMHKRYEIISMFNREMIAQLLVPAIPLVNRIKKRVDLERNVRMFGKAIAVFERPVFRRIVNDENVNLIAISQRSRDSVHHVGYRGFRLVSDDKDEASAFWHDSGVATP